MNQTREPARPLERAADALADMMQTIFLFVLHPFERLSSKLGDRLKGALISASFFLLLVLVYLQHTNLSDEILRVLPLPSIVRYVFFDLIGCLLMAVVAVCSIRAPLRRIRCNATMIFLWGGLCVSFILAAIYTSLDWAGLSLIFLFVFPCVYFIWNNRGDYGVLYALFMRGVFAFHIVFLTGSILLSPIGSGQYRALFTNANSLGQYLTLVTPLFLFRYGMVMDESGYKIKIAPLVGVGVSVAFIFFSASRTALLANVIVFAFWFFCKFLIEKWGLGLKELAFVFLRRALPLILAVAICMPVSFGLIKGCTMLVYSTLAGMDLLSGDYQYLDPSLSGQLDVLMNRIEIEGKDADQLSTHRTLIWNAFASRVKPLGHERGKIYVRNYGVAGTAHNCLIQIAYDCGPGAAVFYFAINAFTGLRALWYYLRRRKADPYALFPVLMMPGFLATSLLASAYPPFAYGVALLYWLVQAPLFPKKVTPVPDEALESARDSEKARALRKG